MKHVKIRLQYMLEVTNKFTMAIVGVRLIKSLLASQSIGAACLDKLIYVRATGLVARER